MTVSVRSRIEPKDAGVHTHRQRERDAQFGWFLYCTEVLGYMDFSQAFYYDAGTLFKNRNTDSTATSSDWG